MDKEIVEYYAANKKEILPRAKAWMDPEGTVLNEVSQMERQNIS